MLHMSAAPAAPMPAHRRSHRSRPSCRRSCGARLHFTRHCLAQCAPHRRPLNRRDGSDPPGSPASISRSPVQRKSGFRPAGAGFGVTPHASLMQLAHARVLPAVFKHFRRLLSPSGASPCQRFVGPSVCSGKGVLSHCNRLSFFGPGSQSIRPGSPEHTRILADRTAFPSRLAAKWRSQIRSCSRSPERSFSIPLGTLAGRSTYFTRHFVQSAGLSFSILTTVRCAISNPSRKASGLSSSNFLFFSSLGP